MYTYEVVDCASGADGQKNQACVSETFVAQPLHVPAPVPGTFRPEVSATVVLAHDVDLGDERVPVE